MGQYIQFGICYNLEVDKKQMNSNVVSYDDLVDGLSKEFDLDLYNIHEDDNKYIFSIKNEVLENGKLDPFLLEQYKLFAEPRDKSEEILNKLKELNKIEEIIEFAQQKPYQNFQYSSMYKTIYCGKWKWKINVQIEMITFFLAGKIMMESYYSFLKYIEALIRKENKYKVSGAIKVLIG